MDNCIEHHQRGFKGGYGTARFEGRAVPAHRAAYCKANGCSLDDISGLLIRHTCDNPRCVNPEHLITGTHADNSQDMVGRGRSASGELNGSAKLTEAAVHQIRMRYVKGCRLNGSTALAREFGVHRITITRAANGERWGKLNDNK